MLKKYLIYSKNNCPQCMMAINLLSSKGIDYEVIKVDEGDGMSNLINHLGRLRLTTPRSVPVIFGYHDGAPDIWVGSYQNLLGLESPPK